MAEVVMPRLSDTMEQGTVAKWLKRPGERVSKGEPIAEIETDKANLVLEAYENGVLERIVVLEGQMVPIGETIAIISSERSAGAAPPSAAQAPAPSAAPKETARVAAPPQALPQTTEREGAGRLRISPVARHIAEEHDVDLRNVAGTGPGGRITKEDVERILREREPGQQVVPPSAAGEVTGPSASPPVKVAPPAEKLFTEGLTLSRMQSTIARRMVESKTTIPHFYITNEVAVDAALEFRQALVNALGEDAKIGVNDLIVKAAALALVKFPDVNASFAGDRIEYHEHVHVGIAVAVPHGLVVPVLRDADRKPLPEIAREAKDLVEKTRASRLGPAEWEGATFTVSNLGMYDVDEFTAIITPPQSAILAVGSIRRVPVALDDRIVIAQRMKLTLSADHRVYYGAMGAEFLREVKRLLENPLALVL